MNNEQPKQVTREPGFYWVKDGRDWIVGEYCGDDIWYIVAADGIYKTVDFNDIRETRIKAPDEPVIYYTAETIPENKFVTLLPNGEMVPHTDGNLERLQQLMDEIGVIDAQTRRFFKPTKQHE